MGFAFVSFSRLDLTTYLDVDLGPPGTPGVFLISLNSTPFPFPPLIVLQVPIPSIFEMDLTLEELTVDNVRNLSVAVLGVNEEPELFDRVSLVNATVVYSVPGVPTLSTWMMALLGVMLLGAGIIFRRRFVNS
ncbi:MAG: IPTL-CTERM sorting domain-containing protein [Candidatus Dadabacteria bacterium]|nr:IPTL-CTERM sorting domain-containing protein [Candidatus Dadabacteria bacterium]